VPRKASHFRKTPKKYPNKQPALTRRRERHYRIIEERLEHIDVSKMAIAIKLLARQRQGKPLPRNLPPLVDEFAAALVTPLSNLELSTLSHQVAQLEADVVEGNSRLEAYDREPGYTGQVKAIDNRPPLAIASELPIMNRNMAWSDELRFRTCPWCNTKDVAMIVHDSALSLHTAKGARREWSWMSCPRCGGVVSVETPHTGSSAELTVVPSSKTEVDIKYLPDDVAEYYGNAIQVLEAGVPSSAAVELRRTVEAAAKHYSVEKHSLVESINELVTQGLVTKRFGDAVSVIRKIGNQGAHASDQKLTDEEVHLALRFTTQMLKNLFEVPGELNLIEKDTSSTDDIAPASSSAPIGPVGS
jgi:hypothetical protein